MSDYLGLFPLSRDCIDMQSRINHVFQVVSHFADEAASVGPFTTPSVHLFGVDTKLSKNSSQPFVVATADSVSSFYRPAPDLWAFCHGEIDNSNELHADCKNNLEYLNGIDRLSHSGVTVTSAQWVLAAYETWNTKCPKHLLGDYAFVIWDGREGHLGRGKIFCVREAMKLRPFYWSMHEGYFQWSSHPRLLISSGTPSDYDSVYFSEYMLDALHKSERTPYRAIKRLRGGHSLSLFQSNLDSSKGILTDESWWCLPDPESLEQTCEDACEELVTLLDQAVRSRLGTQGPVAIAFSGGVDSATVAYSAKMALKPADGPSQLEKTLFGLTLALSGQLESDESPYSQAVADYIGLDLRIVNDNVTPRDTGSGYFTFPDSCLSRLAEPNMLSGFWSLYRSLANACISQECKNLLTGVGGDELFSGNLSYLSQLVLQGRSFLLTNELKRWRRAGYSWHQLLKTIHAGMIYDEKSLHPRSNSFTWLRHNSPKSRTFGGVTSHHPLLRAHHRTITSVEQPMDAIAQTLFAPAGVEIRHPYWDRRIAEWAYRLPLEKKINPRSSKPLLKDAFATKIPAQLYQRQVNLSAYVSKGIYENWNEICSLLESPPPEMEPLVDFSVLRKEVSQLRRAGRGRYLLPSVILAFWIDAQRNS